MTLLLWSSVYVWMDVVERCFHSAINSTKHYLQLCEIVAEFKINPKKRNVFSHFEINWQAIISSL